MTKEQQLITALKLGVITWFQFFEQWRALNDTLARVKNQDR